MPCFVLARRAVLGAVSAAVLGAAFTPSLAWAEPPNPSACRYLYHGTPPGSLAITTDPPSGTVLHPGDDVEVTATWDTADWPAPDLHKILDCLLVDGRVDYDQSRQEKPTANDGYYRYRFTVPMGTDGRICDRVRLSGRLTRGGPLVVQKSNTVCFTVAGGGAAVPGSETDEISQAASPVKPATPASRPSEVLTQAAVPVGPATPASTPTPAPAAELPAAELRDVAPPMLPRTGSDILPLTWLGTALVLLGGVTTLGGTKPRD